MSILFHLYFHTKQLCKVDCETLEPEHKNASSAINLPKWKNRAKQQLLHDSKPFIYTVVFNYLIITVTMTNWKWKD